MKIPQTFSSSAPFRLLLQTIFPLHLLRISGISTETSALWQFPCVATVCTDNPSSDLPLCITALEGWFETTIEVNMRCETDGFWKEPYCWYNNNNNNLILYLSTCWAQQPVAKCKVITNTNNSTKINTRIKQTKTKKKRSVKFVYICTRVSINIRRFTNNRSQWPRGLRHELSSPARTLGSQVRIPLKSWIYVCVYSVFVLFCV
jgi:hypothetical protein